MNVNAVQSLILAGNALGRATFAATSELSTGAVAVHLDAAAKHIDDALCRLSVKPSVPDINDCTCVDGDSRKCPLHPYSPILNGTNPRGDARLLAAIAATSPAGTATAAQDAPGVDYPEPRYVDGVNMNHPLNRGQEPRPTDAEGDRFENAGGGNREDIKP